MSAIFAGIGEVSAQRPANRRAARPAVKRPLAKLPAVTRIDDAALRELIKPRGRPLLINFWATWCVPCREEFPDLVKLHGEYSDKIDLIVISLDDLAEIDRDVPAFLRQQRATMPAYLLKTADENAAIAIVTNEWQGGLPFSILYAPAGTTAYFRQGPIKLATIRSEIEKLLASPAAESR